MLRLPVEFLHESLIWDAAHRLEFVHDNVKFEKKCKKDQYGNVVAVATAWIQGLDTNLVYNEEVKNRGAALRPPKCITQHWRGISRIVSFFLDKMY